MLLFRAASGNAIGPGNTRSGEVEGEVALISFGCFVFWEDVSTCPRATWILVGMFG